MAQGKRWLLDPGTREQQELVMSHAAIVPGHST